MYTTRTIVGSGSTHNLASGTYMAPVISSSSGGALNVAANGTVNLTGNTEFSYNEVRSTGGGAIYLANGAVLNGSGYTLTLWVNTAAPGPFSYGGALYAAGNFTYDGNLVANNNKADRRGGAIYAAGNVNVSGGVSMDNNWITDSFNGREGGAICADGNVTLASGSGDVSLTNNSTLASWNDNGKGGAIYAGSNTTIGNTNSTVTITGNRSGAGGAAIFASSGKITITGSAIDISNNLSDYQSEASGNSGALQTDREVEVNLTAGGMMTASSNSGGFVRSGTTVFNIGAGAVATIGNASSIVSNIANGTDSISSSRIDKNGAGTLILNQANNLYANTNLNGGTTVLNGVLYNGEFAANTGTTYVNNTATLTGTGTVRGRVHVRDGGVIAPGKVDSSGNLSAGILNVNGLTIDSTSAMDILFGKQTAGMGPVAGSDYSQILAATGGSTLTNPISLAGTLNLSLGDNIIEQDDVYTLIRNQTGKAIVGSFTTITIDGVAVSLSGNTFIYNDGAYLTTFEISYTSGTSGRDLVIKAVELEPIPEPGTWALILGGLGVLGCLQRARRRSN